MPAEENKAVVSRMLDELFNKGNLDLTDELIASDFVAHDPAMPEGMHGPEEFTQYVGGYRSAFPDIHIAVEDQVAEGDRVAAGRAPVPTRGTSWASPPPAPSPGETQA